MQAKGRIAGAVVKGLFHLWINCGMSGVSRPHKT